MMIRILRCSIRAAARRQAISTIAAVNLALEAISVFISVVIIGCLLGNEDRGGRLNRLFIWMLVFNIGVLISDAITWIFEGMTGPTVDVLIRVANVCVYSFGYVILALFTDYLITFIGTKTRVSRRILRIITCLCVVAILLVLVSQANHMYYHFDAQNVYHRGDLYWLSQVWAIALMVVNAVLVMYHRRHLSAREIFALLTYELLPVVAMTIQIFVYGLTLLYISTTLSMFIIYVSIQVEQSQRLRRQEQELTESRVAIMLSQIQPHFLYNALVAIKQLCDIDQDQAKEAIGDFSDYLRMNLDSLTRKHPVRFAEELEHVKTYLALEKRRFGDRLQIDYDIRAENFLLPSLSLQPIVENAIRHGVMKRKEGGTVRIVTEETAVTWQVIVRDDGMGFNPRSEEDDGRSHIGIENVRNRLTAISGGSLSIDSEAGVGTTVTIIIPKEGK